MVLSLWARAYFSRKNDRLLLCKSGRSTFSEVLSSFTFYVLKFLDRAACSITRRPPCPCSRTPPPSWGRRTCSRRRSRTPRLRREGDDRREEVTSASRQERRVVDSRRPSGFPRPLPETTRRSFFSGKGRRTSGAGALRGGVLGRHLLGAAVAVGAAVAEGSCSDVSPGTWVGSGRSIVRSELILSKRQSEEHRKKKKRRKRCRRLPRVEGRLSRGG